MFIFEKIDKQKIVQKIWNLFTDEMCLFMKKWAQKWNLFIYEIC
jgi:hypothetical protein